MAVPVASAAPPTAETARALLWRSPAEAVAAYQAWDAGYREGLGASDAVTSGELAWSESTFLRNYLSCWRISGDRYWLDKFIDHFDRMLSHQTDRAGTGHPAWDSLRYSVGTVVVKELRRTEGMRLEPAERREPAAGRGGKITGHRYAVVFATADTLRVIDLDRDAVVLNDVPYAGKLVIDLFTARTWPAQPAPDAVAPLTLSGPGRAGARFVIETSAPEWLQFVVHDGMITYPMAQFVEAVAAAPDLPASYRAAADRYAAWFAQHVYAKWEPCWRAMDDGTGAYTSTHAKSERFPGYLLPHDQYLALARAYVVLQGVPGLPGADGYRAKARAMARYFRRHLRTQADGTAWLWNYWDPSPGEAVDIVPEDDAHAAIDAGFVVEAARRGFEFTAEDAAKLARTYTAVMSDGDAAAPRISARVDGSGAKTRVGWWEWALLGEFDESVLRQVSAMAGPGEASAPQRGEVLARLGGVQPAEREAMAAQTVTLSGLLAAAADGNLSFELGLRDAPLGWRLSRGPPADGAGSIAWATEACDGSRSLALVGEEGTPNLSAESRALALPKPAKVSVTVRYRTSGGAVPALSAIYLRPGEPDQLEPGPRLKPSRGWGQATWSFTPPVGTTAVRVAVHNTGVGTVWYDALRVDRPTAEAPR